MFHKTYASNFDRMIFAALLTGRRIGNSWHNFARTGGRQQRVIETVRDSLGTVRVTAWEKSGRWHIDWQGNAQPIWHVIQA